MLKLSSLFRWLGGGVIAATLLWTGTLAVITIVLDGAATFAGSLPYAWPVVVAGLMWSLVACVFYGPVLAMWPRVVHRWPAIEVSWRWILVATGILALPPTIIAPLMATTFPFGSPDYFREFLTWLIPVGSMSWGGLFLPRVLIPTLRPGAFAESRSLTSA